MTTSGAIAATLETRHGTLTGADAPRWLAPASAVDARALTRATPPVLDVGCGPGRHVRWLRDLGIPVLGIDLTPAAVRRARAEGVPVELRCVFSPVPREGSWGTVLLLDGNLGIGGDPAALLRRCRSLLRPRGRVLAELAPEGTPHERTHARLSLGGVPGPWFPWTTVPAHILDGIAAAGAMRVAERWSDRGRAFAVLERLPDP